MGVVFRKMKIRGLHDQVVVLLAAMRCEIPDGCSANLTLPNYGRVARHSGAVQRSDPMYALPAKAAIFRRARLLFAGFGRHPNSCERTRKEVRHDAQVG